mmetsp:Transcript_5198/g.12214  ORF Transcript_5198/g.12214 Transcript_5198/m.12214 type:complete len:236 (-) Transcript_5198:264-971(-)
MGEKRRRTYFCTFESCLHNPGVHVHPTAGQDKGQHSLRQVGGRNTLLDLGETAERARLRRALRRRCGGHTTSWWAAATRPHASEMRHLQRSTGLRSCSTSSVATVSHAASSVGSPRSSSGLTTTLGGGAEFGLWRLPRRSGTSASGACRPIWPSDQPWRASSRHSSAWSGSCVATSTAPSECTKTWTHGDMVGGRMDGVWPLCTQHLSIHQSLSTFCILMFLWHPMDALHDLWRE